MDYETRETGYDKIWGILVVWVVIPVGLTILLWSLFRHLAPDIYFLWCLLWIYFSYFVGWLVGSKETL